MENNELEEPTTPPPPLETFKDDDDILEYTLGVRRQIVETLYAKSGGAIHDHKDIGAVDAMLRGMEGIALKRKQIKVEEQTNDNNTALIGALVAETLRNANEFSKIYRSEKPVGSIPVLTIDAPATFVEGEVADTASRETCEDFMERMADKD